MMYTRAMQVWISLIAAEALIIRKLEKPTPKSARLRMEYSNELKDIYEALGDPNGRPPVLSDWARSLQKRVQARATELVLNHD